ncbi:MAG: DUF5132 domain-containing protein [Acetobacteraceae bacterium]|nr:DUF5132 domain-containing protein [Acetobacteraceae bacterium]
MAFWENVTESITESGAGTGLVVAAGALLVFPLVRPLLREAAKAVIKGGLIAYDQATRMGATVQESMSDMVAEIHAERREDSGPRSPADSTHEHRTRESGDRKGAQPAAS